MSTVETSPNIIERDLRWRFLKLEDKLDHIQLTLAAILEELAHQRKEMTATVLDARKQEDPRP
jgi:hypothetical protein